MATLEESDNTTAETARMPLWQKELIERRKHVTKAIANHPTDGQSQQHLIEDTPETHTSTKNGIMMTNTEANHRTDTNEDGTYTTGLTTGHSHSEQLAQHHQASSSMATATQLLLQATNTSVKNETFTAEPSSVQEINIQSHSRHGNERFASDSSNSTSSSLSGLGGKKCTFNKNSNLVNKSNNSVNKYTKFSERVQLKSPGTMVAMPELLSENNNLDDTSEELQYGPGFVSLLRCRYLSLALRQSSGKQRPSLDNLRRATSLNNLIDDENEQITANRQTWNNQELNNTTKEKARTPDEYIPSLYGERNEQNENRCRPNQRGNDSLKRARSVEALMRYDQTAWQRDINKDSIDQTATMIVLEEITNENNKVNSITDCVNIEEKIIQARERGEHKPKRLTSFMDETERPPPDLVKHTLRIFEASANRRLRIGAKGNGDVAAKVANYKTIIMQEKPQIVYPKPPLSPKKPVIKPRTSSPKQVLNGNRYTNGNGNGIDPNKLPAIDINVAKSNFESPTIVSPTSNGARKITDNSRSPSPLAVRVDMAYRTNKFESSPLLPVQTTITNGQSAYSTSSISPISPAPRPMPRQEILRNLSDTNARNNTDSPMAALSRKLEILAIDSPNSNMSKLNLSDGDSDQADSSCNDVADDESDVDKPSKRISKIALDNISRAGVTTEFNFFAQSSKSHLPSGPLNGNSSTPIKTTSSSDTNEQSVRQIGIIRPQVKATVTPTATTVVPSKVMNKKDNNQSVVISESSIGVDEKPNRDKLLITLTTREIEKNLINKEKSDEIKWAATTKNNSAPPIAKSWQKQEQNNTMVFNFSNKKDVPDYIEKFENDGLVVRRKRDWTKPGESGFVMLGDLTLETSTDPDDSYPLGPPSPCDVEFHNDNVIIDGKSSLRDKSIDRKLKIHFNESLTSVFEYPSESSMLAEDGENGMVSGLLGSMALGSAPLGSYTPIKASITTSFELGVTRSQSPLTESSAAVSTNGESSESLQYLKPATDEQTVAWSEGTRATDLLF